MILAAARQTGAETATAACLMSNNAPCARQPNWAHTGGRCKQAVIDVALCRRGGIGVLEEYRLLDSVPVVRRLQKLEGAGHHMERMLSLAICV